MPLPKATFLHGTHSDTGQGALPRAAPLVAAPDRCGTQLLLQRQIRAGLDCLVLLQGRQCFLAKYEAMNILYLRKIFLFRRLLHELWKSWEEKMGVISTGSALWRRPPWRCGALLAQGPFYCPCSQAMPGVQNGCKAWGEASHHPGNVCQISVFPSQNWVSYLIEQNSPLPEPPVLAHGVHAGRCSLAEV